MASSYQPVPASERKIKLPRLYLEKKDPTLWRGLEAPEGWVELWKEHQEEVRLKKEGKLTQLKEIREERRKKKISLAIQKNWERKKKKQEAENKKLLTSKELSKEEIEAVKSLAREHLIDFGVYMGTEKGELYQPAWFHEEMADELMKVANGTSEYDILMFWLPPGSGKEISDSVPVLTLDGWKTHGELSVGDFVFGIDGKPVRVEHVSEKVQSNMIVEFMNGETIPCHENHEWTLFDRAAQKFITCETKYLVRKTKHGKQVSLTSGTVGRRGGRYQYQIPNHLPVQFPEKELVVNPYVLGAWLGDGTSSSAAITGDKKDFQIIDEVKKFYPVSSVNIHKTTGCLTTRFGNGGNGNADKIQYNNHGKCKFVYDLETIGVFKNKHIPDCYKFSSVNQRLELLAGLIDTDGHVDKQRSRVTITTVSRKLIDDIAEVVQSLGWRNYIIEAQPVLSTSGIQGKKVVYTIGFNPLCDIPTKLPRKKITRFPKQRRIGIKSVTRKDGEFGHCIQVSAKDGLYLVGKKLVPTHNSRLATQLFPAYMLGKDPTTQIIVTSYSGDLAEKFGSNTRDIMESKKYQSLFETFLRKDSRSKDNWETTKGGSYNAVGLGGSITGKRANIFIIDDLIRGRAEANSKSYRDNAWDFFMSTAFTRGANRLSQKKPIYIFCNTRWHTDDVPGRLLEMQKEGGEHLPKMKVISYPAIAEVDEKHRKAGEALWEKGYPLSELNKVKATITGYEWSALYQQNPITAENQEFKVETFQEIALDDVLKDSNRVFMSIDTAISRKSSGDFTGITLNFVNKENKWRIMTWQRRFSPKELIEFIFQKWEQYKIEKIGIEKTIYKDAIQEFFNDEMRRRGKFPYIVELQHNQTNKETRVRGLLPYYESKTVYHIKGHCEGLENELLNFPMGKHDDVIDSLAYQIQLAEQLVVRGPTLKRKPFMKYI